MLALPLSYTYTELDKCQAALLISERRLIIIVTQKSFTLEHLLFQAAEGEVIGWKIPVDRFHL